ncbi:hypothetical protein EKO04_008545 [Ascochyta lentis]|uniref:Uncharacterized protein n=1 Tax=Ascochyta lentis TaxID=205686 RepID=A0A8H7IZ48_9PLEO|nr:hypothetical protein EKO04_008545 [Ascochyta lentis]
MPQGWMVFRTRAARRRLSESGRNMIAEENQKNSPLLRLPAEIRNIIYAYALSTATVRHRRRGLSVYHDNSMLLTCRQIRYEARRESRRARSTYTSLVINGLIHFETLVMTITKERCAQIESVGLSKRLAIVLSASGRPVYAEAWGFAYAREFTALGYVVVDGGEPDELRKEKIEKGLRTCFGNVKLKILFR